MPSGRLVAIRYYTFYAAEDVPVKKQLNFYLLHFFNEKECYLYSVFFLYALRIFCNFM